jgi:hypothetical protein
MNIINSKPIVEKIDNTELVSTFHAEGGRVVHVRPDHGKRSMTVAYKLKGSRIEFATSVQNRHDTFTKKIGTKLAIEHFHQGKTVIFPFSTHTPIAETFGWIYSLINLANAS